jgi:xylose isomerase
LAGHTFSHDLQVCADHGMLGSVDANQGDSINGWDTDEFPTNIYETTQAMLVILRNGGLGNGGLNFDAKRRRNSTDLEDLFIAHIGGMDSFALGLKSPGDRRTGLRLFVKDPIAFRPGGSKRSRTAAWFG